MYYSIDGRGAMYYSTDLLTILTCQATGFFLLGIPPTKKLSAHRQQQCPTGYASEYVRMTHFN